LASLEKLRSGVLHPEAIRVDMTRTVFAVKCRMVRSYI